MPVELMVGRCEEVCGRCEVYEVSREVGRYEVESASVIPGSRTYSFFCGAKMPGLPTHI